MLEVTRSIVTLLWTKASHNIHMKWWHFNDNGLFELNSLNASLLKWFAIYNLLHSSCYTSYCYYAVKNRSSCILCSRDHVIYSHGSIMHSLLIFILSRPMHLIAYYGSNHFFFQVKPDLNPTWTTVDRVMVPPNQAHQCNHTCLDGEALMRSIVMPLAGASNEGRLCARATLIR